MNRPHGLGCEFFWPSSVFGVVLCRLRLQQQQEQELLAPADDESEEVRV